MMIMMLHVTAVQSPVQIIVQTTPVYLRTAKMLHSAAPRTAALSLTRALAVTTSWRCHIYIALRYSLEF